MSDAPAATPRRPTQFSRQRSTFRARTATDDEHQLDRRLSANPASPSPGDASPLSAAVQPPLRSGEPKNPYEPIEDGDPVEDYQQHHHHSLIGKLVTSSGHDGESGSRLHIRSSSGRRKSKAQALLGDSLTADMHASNGKPDEEVKPKPGAFPRPVGGSAKLGTFAGVFVPTSLNVLSILMFLRFGFILGQSGFLGMMGMLIACYAINLLTTMSISAIATNGTVRGGGAYYLISRSLGPEFGGSIGIVFYLGFVLNTSMNAVGLIDCLDASFGINSGNMSNWLPDGFWWRYLWATTALVMCTLVCLAGSGIFARCSNGLLAILLVATFSIPLSTLIKQPFENPRLHVKYTGLSFQTFKENLLPRLTKGAEGSQLKGKETWQDLFGILFPATGGIFAGASMSGDLKHPSKAIPKGTLYGLVLTFFSYSLVILAMAASISRTTFHRNTNVIQDVNMSGVIILMGEIATSLFSALMGVIGSAKLLQALARDHLIPGLSLFGQGTKGNDEPTYAIFITYLVAQLAMLCDINQIASFVTMTYLMTFLVTNLACFLLKISSAPNFRPSFHYFSWKTAAVGTIVSGATMFFVDGTYASGCVGILVFIFLLIHYTTPPKSWGDVSQSLIYHQVRKYLLRLRQEHVKFWRPQILLFVNDPRRQYGLIQFCNSLKKGGMYVLGHVLVSQDFAGAVPEARRQQTAWTKYIDFSKIKAFVNIAISPAIEWGTRNVVLSAGLGGMRPNIVIMGFFNLNDLRRTRPLVDVPSPQPSRPVSVAEHKPPALGKSSGNKRRRRSKVDKLRGILPTDANRPEGAISAQSYLTILEDLLLRLQINVAIAKGFQELEFPVHKPTKSERALELFHLKEHEEEENSKKYIDLWPIQMSAEVAADCDNSKRNVLTTNFDTYTLILQLGCILNTVPSWKRAYKLRVAVFVEYESDVEEERGRVTTLLSNLRIEAEVLVFWLASGALKTYEIIVNGKIGDDYKEALKDVDEALESEEWWQDVRKMRDNRGSISAVEELAGVSEVLSSASNWPASSFQHGRQDSQVARFHGLKKMIRKAKRRASVSGLRGVNMGMTTHRLDPELVNAHATLDSASETTSSTDSDYSSESEYAASENDIESSSDDEPISPIRRSRSAGASERPTDLRKGILRRSEMPPKASSLLAVPQLEPQSSNSDTAVSVPTGGDRPVIPRSDTAGPGGRLDTLRRPPVMRHQSMPKFTSKPVPKTEVATHDGPGPSIMFSEQLSPDGHNQRHAAHHSIYTHSPSPSTRPGPSTEPRIAGESATPSATPQQASGYPFPASIPLTFNDLPCRAQHLILNELMRAQSSEPGETAVVFTTLPSPVEGTCASEEDSVRYLSDLEVLCLSLPPTLLVHSNSLTVTMSL